MLALDSARWSELTHAYGGASDVPVLLTKAAESCSSDAAQDDPYSSLWSALCHQGDVYTASYAAVPYLIEIAKSGPSRASFDPISLVAAIETARLQGKGPAIPEDLAPAYVAALSALPEIAAGLLEKPLSEQECREVFSALAAAKGHPQLAKAVCELAPDIADKLLSRWIYE
ncbi:MAG: hypothetical protein Kow00114_05670 [Kiloniellaceae bacterium]